MESIYGHSLAHVHIHTNAEAARISAEQHAHAVTIGNDIAFAAGEYKPGTLIGDVLIAHELAHVVQQREANQNTPAARRGSVRYVGLENDANTSTIRAIASLWSSTKQALAGIAHGAKPRLKTGLTLQRCEVTDTEKKQAQAAFQAVVSGIITGRRQPIPVPFPDPDAAQGMLDIQYAYNREDFIMWQAGLGHSPKWEKLYGTNYIDWSAYREYGDSFAEIWPHFLRDAWNGTIPRERDRGQGGRVRD